MTKKTPTQAAEILRSLTIKVKNGVISSAEAERLAVLALQEVEEAQPDLAEGDENTEEQEQTPIKNTPTSSAIDPKSKILSLLTRTGEGVQTLLKTLETEVTALLKETAGAAVPVGDFSIGSDVTQSQHVYSAKLTIEAGEKPAQAKVSYLLRKDWSVDSVQLPVEGSVARSCNLPLRQEVLELCADVRENTNSELTWKKGKKLPLEQVARIENLAQATGDYRVAEILEARPVDALAESWKKWAIAGQVYLLGSDFSENKGFAAIRQGL